MRYATKYYIVTATIITCIISTPLKPEWSFNNMFSWIYTPSETTTFSKKIQVTPDCILSLTALVGNVTITSWNQPTIFIEAELSGKANALKATSIELKTSDTNPVKQVHITTTLKNGSETAAKAEYTIMVPYYVQLKIDMQKGDLLIKHVEAPTRAFVQEGKIDLILKQMTGDSSFLIETGRGNITLLAPRNLNAHMRAHTISGTVTSELPITTFPKTILLNKDMWNQIKKEAEGMLGDGNSSSPITLETAKGNIMLKEYK